MESIRQLLSLQFYVFLNKLKTCLLILEFSLGPYLDKKNIKITHRIQTVLHVHQRYC